MQQLEAVSHIAQGDAVALAALAGRHGVGDLDHGDLAAKARGNAQLRAAGARLHAVLDGVFHQRLQDQRRQARSQRARIQRPLHAQALAKADLLNVQIAPRQLDFLRQRGAVALLGKSVAEQVRQVFQHALGLFRLAAHQGDGGVERVEQKVRANARLQLRQPRRGGRRRAAAHAPHQRRRQHGRQQRSGHGAGQPGRRGAHIDRQRHENGAGRQPCQRAQRHARRHLRLHGQARQRFFQTAPGHQPQQRGRQRAARDKSQAQQPLQRAARHEQQRRRLRRLHPQHGAQHHARAANVKHQRRLGARRRSSHGARAALAACEGR